MGDLAGVGVDFIDNRRPESGEAFHAIPEVQFEEAVVGAIKRMLIKPAVVDEPLHVLALEAVFLHPLFQLGEGLVKLALGEVFLESIGVGEVDVIDVGVADFVAAVDQEGEEAAGFMDGPPGCQSIRIKAEHHHVSEAVDLSECRLEDVVDQRDAEVLLGERRVDFLEVEDRHAEGGDGGIVVGKRVVVAFQILGFKEEKLIDGSMR